MGAQFQSAIKQFDDNRVRIGGDAAAQTDPEKFNLYSGLSNLAEGLEQLERKIDQLLQRG